MACAGLSCGYPGRTVLTGVDLDLTPGSVTALLGPNGSGKSTLLKTLCGTLPTLGGSVTVEDSPARMLSAVQLAKKVAFVPQEESYPFRFTVRQVVLMGRFPHSPGLFDTAEDLAAAERAMQTADCLEFADRHVTEISGGEKQRVLIARALAQEARVLLLDEPTSHLDVGHQVAFSSLAGNLAAKGYAILAAVHDLNLASSFARQAILLQGGRVGLTGPIRTVIESPILDDVYGVRFRRFEDGGRLRVFAAV